ALEKAALEKAALEKAALEKAALEKAALKKTALKKAALKKGNRKPHHIVQAADRFRGDGRAAGGRKPPSSKSSEHASA
ncbi:MAG TPA: hypothetical protein VKS60_07390, partial [Stellaceae bacterium]|nr:hypothetical protein [Stellaceae bacterium]